MSRSSAHEPPALVDVTLREGEQRPGRRYSAGQKVEVARQLDALGVDYVQVGFPVVGEVTAAVCAELDLDAKTTGIARALDGDVEAAIEAEVDVVDLFAPTSDRQRTQLLDCSREELLSRVHDAVDAAQDAGCEVHFSAMDGFRTDPGFLSRLVEEVDAEYVVIADTVGSRTPRGVEETLAAVGENDDLSHVGVHFHDDLGVATANALAAADCGAGRIDVSVAGVGERAGNTPLEQFVAACVAGDERTEVGVETDRLLPAARAVLSTLGESVPSSKPLLGEGAFAHESGLHTAAMLDDPATFEPFDPATFGGERQLLFGSASGAGAARGLLRRAGTEPTFERVSALLAVLDDADEDLPLGAAVELAESVANAEREATEAGERQ
ncbi:LeuA family protein [Haloprofundus salilacus]|uniref:LeuA family protein n=1 Tax=Haloprofundus salilacus TaxID=2876190 RepID=UPI001CCE464E|nr:LeuA family protein [Haloprofundus salilacus]